MKKLTSLGNQFDKSALDRRVQRIHAKTEMMTRDMMEKELGLADFRGNG